MISFSVDGGKPVIQPSHLGSVLLAFKELAVRTSAYAGPLCSASMAVITTSTLCVLCGITVILRGVQYKPAGHN